MSAVLPSDIFTFDDGDDSGSPTNALFPPNLTFPGLDALDQLDSNAYLSPNTLSPRSADLTHPSLSPPASGDSPSSSLSFATDEYLLNNSFGQDELDMLIFPEDSKPDMNLADALVPFQSAFSASIPFDLRNPTYDAKPNVEQPQQQQHQQPQQPQQQQHQHQQQQQPAQQIPSVPMGAIQPAAFDGLLHQWRLDLSQSAQAAAAWSHAQMAASHPIYTPAPQQQPQQQIEVIPAPASVPVEVQQQQQQHHHQLAQTQAQAQPPPRRSAPNAPLNKPTTSSPPANVGKHNKTERRYRQKVQQAQADLRDAVPALRVLYGTSTDEQKQTTDIRAPDGTVDGLGEVTRPNASAKATILIGARMYIELLQRRTAMLQRKVSELEAWRQQVAGAEDLTAWRTDFDRREAVIAAQQAAIAAAAEGSDDEESEEEEEDTRSRKRPRTTKKSKAAEAKAATGVRAFAAFAVSFSLVPSASKMFSTAPTATAAQQGTVYATEHMTRNQIITRLPYITAEHSSRLLARALPAAIVPGPTTIVDWTFRLLVALALVTIIAPILERVSRKYQDKKTGAGNISGLGKDLVKLVVGSPVESAPQWTNLAARVVGGLAKPPAMVKWHVAVRLRQASNDPYSLALYALLAPEKPSSRIAWVEARSKCEANSPLAAVLALPLEEAAHSLTLVPPTGAPIASIAEQINLVHLYDLYTRFFVHLVGAVGDATSLSPMLVNVQQSDLPTELNSLGREIRSVLHGMPRHSPSHALSLVLLGLWGLFSGYSQPAILVSALAAEEVQGAGASLASVSAMLELLYPGSSNPMPSVSASLVPGNAQAIDKLAMACIGFVDLLFSSSKHQKRSTRVERLEASQRIQKEAARLRLVLTQATFVGLDEEDEDEGLAFDDARQKLVSVLCSVGRRAAGRGVIRDDDSGLDDDEEW